MQHWQWRVLNDETLVIDLGKNVTQELSFKRSVLRDCLPEDVSFSMDDAEAFQNFSDYLDSHSVVSSTEQFNIALHATALVRFGKIMLPQSWYFKFGPYGNEKLWPKEHLFCALTSNNQHAGFLIIEQDERCSLCMLVDKTFEVGGFKTMKQYEVTRVLNDRLQESQRHPISKNDSIATQHWA